MATRNYYIAGDSTLNSAITVWIDDQEVFSGPVQVGDPGTNWRADPAQYHFWSANAGPRLALIEFETADHSETQVQMRVRCDSGVIAVAEIMVHGPILPNPLLSDEEREYLGDVAEESIPQSVIDSVNAKGGWRTRRADLMTWPNPHIDIRSNVQINGNLVETQPEDLPRTYIEISEGDEIAMTLSLPEMSTLDRYTQPGLSHFKGQFQSTMGSKLTDQVATVQIGPAGVNTELTTEPT